MTTKQGTTRNALQPPPMSLPITHVGLSTSHLGHVRQEGATVEFNLATTRTVLLALSAPGGVQGVRRMRDFFGWPQWQAPSPPTATHEWKAIFSTRTIALEGLFRRAPSGEEPLAVRLATPMPLTDPMWQMLQATGCVVLCTGLAGDPTAAELGTAARKGKLQAVLAQALLD